MVVEKTITQELLVARSFILHLCSKHDRWLVYRKQWDFDMNLPYFPIFFHQTRRLLHFPTNSGWVCEVTALLEDCQFAHGEHDLRPRPFGWSLGGKDGFDWLSTVMFWRFRTCFFKPIWEDSPPSDSNCSFHSYAGNIPFTARRHVW